MLKRWVILAAVAALGPLTVHAQSRPAPPATPRIYIFDNGSISACYLNTTLGVPCQQGGVPIIGVDARSVGDIQAGVRFAVKHNLRLAVKNTG